MSLMPTAPRSIGGVLDNAIRLYVRTLFPCFPILLGAGVLLAIPTLWLTLHMQSLAATDPLAVLGLLKSPAVWLVYVVLLLVSSAVYGALFAQINAMAHGGRLSVGAALGQGVSRAPALFAVGLIFILMIVIGMVLLIIPGIYLWGVFQLAFVPPVIERAGVFQSFGISRRLTKGNWWRTSVIIFVGIVIMYVLVLVVGMVMGIVAVATGGTGTAPAVTSSFLLIQQLVSLVLNLFIMSFLPCLLLAVYHDLKLRNEGADLADRVGALNPAS